MEESVVLRVLDPEAKKGYSEKTKKDWSMSRVELKNGESVFIFNPIDVGDVVEQLEVNGYKNWLKKKVDPKHDEVMKMLHKIYDAITGDAKEDDFPPNLEPPEDL